MDKYDEYGDYLDMCANNGEIPVSFSEYIKKVE